jgi:methylated-DNA-[protein]-cysteine S-methyltransferase
VERLRYWTYYSHVKEKDLRQMKIDTPIGQLTLVASAKGLRRVYFEELTDADVEDLEALVYDASYPTLESTARQIEEYFSGKRRSFDIPLDLVGTDFQIETWHALAKIEYGKTASYGQQAILVGRPRAVRAVGGANRCNPVPIVLPCHRIIGANGKLTGFAGGLETKRWLLEHESARVDSKETMSESQLLCN